MTTPEPWCNHDLPALTIGTDRTVCECGHELTRTELGERLLAESMLELFEPRASDNTNFIPADSPRPCAVCKLPATTIEVNFECALHPGHCARQLWHEYAQALIRSSRANPTDLGDNPR